MRLREDAADGKRDKLRTIERRNDNADGSISGHGESGISVETSGPALFQSSFNELLRNLYLLLQSGTGSVPINRLDGQGGCRFR